MNSKLLKVLLISLSLGVIHTAQAAALNDTPKIVSSTIVTGKPSPIEKALMQQKRGDFKSINMISLKFWLQSIMHRLKIF